LITKNGTCDFKYNKKQKEVSGNNMGYGIGGLIGLVLLVLIVGALLESVAVGGIGGLLLLVLVVMLLTNVF